MKIKYKKEIKDREKVEEGDIIDFILKSRQIKNKKEFLNPTSPLNINLTDFGFKKELNHTLELLKKIRDDEKMIVVYTDYDADGITGGTILWETLNMMGFKTMPYVPHRKKEGYGFSKIGLDNVKKLYHPALIISVDHGISAAEKIAYAKSLGIATIVTDHHLKPEKLPLEAEAIFHLPQLSGAGVAYFFAKEIFKYFGNPHFPNYQLLNTYYESDYLSLAAIGTIADLVPLIGPSRSLVKYGLDVFPKIKRAGIKSILKEAGIEGKKITPYEIGFIIAPRINAVGRLEHAIEALRLLCTNKSDIANSLAAKVGLKNRERQDMVKEAVGEARFSVMKKGLRNKKVIILVSSSWHEGIIGLIASKIAEEFHRPTIVLTKSDGFYKGSARSIPALHITDFLRGLKDHLIDVGGHNQAAGFTLEEKKLKDFISEAEEKIDVMLTENDLEKTIEVDLKIPLSKLNVKLARLIENLSPFGTGNPKPVFYSEVRLVDAKLFGRNYEHLKLFVIDSSQQPSPPLEMISFSSGNKFTQFSRGQKINVVYNLEIDRWGRSEKVRAKILDNQIF